MDKKVLGGGVLVAIAVLGAAWLGGPVAAIVVAVVGVVALVVVLRRSSDEAPPRPRKDRGRRKSRDDEAESRPPRRTRTTTAPVDDANALPTWGGLTAWTPAELHDLAGDTSTGDADTDDAALAAHDTTTSWDAWEREWAGPDTDLIEEPAADEPRLGSFDVEFADLDEEFEQVVAEETRGDDLRHDQPTTILVDEVVIDENVSSADDILAASHATELHVDDSAGADSELAKLLAKVQARLAAYE